MTLHRPSNVDDRAILTSIMKTVSRIAEEVAVIFPCHPRNRSRIDEFGLRDLIIEEVSDSQKISSGVIMLDPLSYNDFLYFWKNCIVMLTDSCGLQEETTALGIPCLTLRQNIERPVTLEMGTNILVGHDMKRLSFEIKKVLNGEGKNGCVPDLWDSKASVRIIYHIRRYPKEISN